MKTLSETAIDCIFIRYTEHSKAYRLYVIEPNASVSVKTIIESIDTIFDENLFSSIPRPKDMVPSSSGITKEVVPDSNESYELRRSKSGVHNLCESAYADAKRANNTLVVTQSLFRSQTLVSLAETFELGFIKPVLRNDSSSIIITPIRQSFDHPYTFLPGGKFGYNKRTNIKQIITSWKSVEDPTMGSFSLEVDQDEKQYVIKWNRSVEYWASGSWNGRIFSHVPEMRLKFIYNFSYIDNENESYFTYSLYNPSIFSKLIMDVFESRLGLKESMPLY
ncbi:G-type lectin S-receptor-like serine/threonine-protein kinase At1g11300 [Lactuca sativa]|uniref:G-type lectin S-receptor-like serine/threonine-protein kinase At1g11300 n=1 Tax=Lactuca sativa TaxID=4236 RepID=UPI0022AE6843|nr:G-type lectin S-receptor-like serine/threonine-protein kinase At1g11300 [Lactuca sativa]